MPVYCFSTVTEQLCTTAAFIATGLPGTPGSYKAHPILKPVSKRNVLLAGGIIPNHSHHIEQFFTEHAPVGHANAEGILERGQKVYYQGNACCSIFKVTSLKSCVSLWEIHQIPSNFLDSSSLE